MSNLACRDTKVEMPRKPLLEAVMRSLGNGVVGYRFRMITADRAVTVLRQNLEREHGGGI